MQKRQKSILRMHPFVLGAQPLHMQIALSPHACTHVHYNSITHIITAFGSGDINIAHTQKLAPPARAFA
jgi:hypothetical protein